MAQTSNRKLIRVTGADAQAFLQGLVTNDVDKLASGLVYAALLTPQGKYLADFFLVPDPEAILIDVDEAVADLLFQRLTMYKLRADVQLEWDTRAVVCGTGPAPEGALPDPRHPEMGWRAYGRDVNAPSVDWDEMRVRYGIPATGIELTPDSFILEMGFERLNGVDFRKGCYVGQEVTARMKHKTELRKGLARVRVDGSAKSGDAILSDGKAAGTLHTRAGDAALAYLRFDRMKAGGTAGEDGAAQVTQID